MKNILRVFIGLLLLTGCGSISVKDSEKPAQIWIVSQKKSPLVYNRLLFSGGSRYDRKGGETYLLSRILSQSELSVILEEQGTSLETEADYDFFALSYEILSEKQRETFSRAARFLLNYEISEGEFQLAKNQLMQELKVQEDRFYDRVRLKFYQELYQPHRYAPPVTGTGESVQKMTLQDIRETYRDLILSSLGGFILVGDEEEEQIKFYHQILSSFGVRDFQSFDTGILPEEKKRTVEIMAPSTQVFVRIGGLGVPRSHPEFLQYLLISDMIGGGLGSVITRRLREEEGLTYSPVANFYSQRQEPGYFFTAYSTRMENLDKSLRLMEEIFEELAEKGISHQNFLMSRRYLYGIFLVREETYAGLAGILSDGMVFGLEKDYWETQKAEISRLDYEAVNRKIKDYFKNRRFLTVILKNS